MRLNRKLAPLVAVLATVSACGGGEQQPSSGAGGHPPSHQAGGAKQAKPERAFLQAMVPHHQSAIEMAEVADKEGEHDALGLSAEEAGMNHMDGGAMLRGKRPFDRAFVDEMVPHHEGAIAMARVVLKETRDPELRKLAQDIIRAQERETSEMNAFRKREYGGGAPREATPSVHGEHGG